jgi:hypothetical protein
VKIFKSIVGTLDKQLAIEETTTYVDQCSSQAGQDMRLPTSPKLGLFTFLFPGRFKMKFQRQNY